MRQRKALESDPATLRDVACAPVERAAALSRLVSDQRREFEADIAGFLEHRDPILRAKAIEALAGRWRIERHVDTAVCLLTGDPDWLVRRNAAHALSMYAQAGQASGQERTSLLHVLARAVQADSDPGVREAAYEAVLRILGRPADEYLHATRDFDSRQDVNWALLAPYLGKADDESS